MEISKISKSGDRLSELPDSLVLLILSFLQMGDVVKTTLISKRFKNLWTTVPCLNFESSQFDMSFDTLEDEYQNVRFQNFVNRALILWKGTKILKFKVELFQFELAPSSDLDVWLRFAMENEVEELYVHLLTEWDPRGYVVLTEYSPPQLLYSCLSIRELSLAGCKLEINGNVQWDQLKYLNIEGVSLSEHVMNQILSSTPQLEVLFLCLAEVYEDLNIHSSSLKALTIEKYNDARVVNVLTIWAPNVETLEILGAPYGNYVIKNVSSLTNATVDISFVEHPDNVQFSGYKLLEDIMGQMYHTSRHVEKVTLSDWCSKMLGGMKKHEKHIFESLSNAKFLKLYDCEIDELMGLLEIFPKLTKLVLENMCTKLQRIYQIHWGIDDPSIAKFDTANNLESQTDFPKSCLLHLKTVEVAWVPLYEDSIFLIVEFLLKNASKLEKLVLRATGSRYFEPESLLLRSERLLKIPRSSPTAEVILCRE